MRLHIDRMRRGFTLVEILAVVVIMGIAGALIVPYLGSRDDLKAAAAARIVMADLIYAQNTAITRQSNHYVPVATGGQSYSLVNSALAIIQHPVNKVNYTQRFGATGTSGLRDAVLVSAQFTNAAGATFSTLGFDEMGSPVVYPAGGPAQAMISGSLVVRSGSYSLRVSIEAFTGQISVATVD